MSPNPRSTAELHQAIDDIIQAYEHNERSLEHYLLAFLALSRPYAETETLAQTDFLNLISSSFTREVPPFEEAWREQYDGLADARNDYDGFAATLIRQIVDLREMEEAGQLDDKFRYFGLNSPRGSRWYNFEPLGYLECAATGCFRLRSEGPSVAQSRSAAGSQASNGEPAGSSSSPISWRMVEGFIVCGRIYE